MEKETTYLGMNPGHVKKLKASWLDADSNAVDNALHFNKLVKSTQATLNASSMQTEAKESYGYEKRQSYQLAKNQKADFLKAIQRHAIVKIHLGMEKNEANEKENRAVVLKPVMELCDACKGEEGSYFKLNFFQGKRQKISGKTVGNLPVQAMEMLTNNWLKVADTTIPDQFMVEYQDQELEEKRYGRVQYFTYEENVGLGIRAQLNQLTSEDFEVFIYFGKDLNKEAANMVSFTPIIHVEINKEAVEPQPMMMTASAEQISTNGVYDYSNPCPPCSAGVN
ncbi:hypothetical protein [Persicobacter diffluens]|uniref:Uncharacterized protein n=1 Tax=Persicobacter diffluens TaxID=981 RepID=A0AAN5AJZ5_9BACT|nr:hypothetical protein PEDI_19140 [Persicobacter diffluens]